MGVQVGTGRQGRGCVGSVRTRSHRSPRSDLSGAPVLRGGGSAETGITSFLSGPCVIRKGVGGSRAGGAARRTIGSARALAVGARTVRARIVPSRSRRPWGQGAVQITPRIAQQGQGGGVKGRAYALGPGRSAAHTRSTAPLRAAGGPGRGRAGAEPQRAHDTAQRAARARTTIGEPGRARTVAQGTPGRGGA